MKPILDRREFIKFSATTVGALILAGCQPQEKQLSPGWTEIPPQAEKDLTYFTLFNRIKNISTQINDTLLAQIATEFNLSLQDTPQTLTINLNPNTSPDAGYYTPRSTDPNHTDVWIFAGNFQKKIEARTKQPLSIRDEKDLSMFFNQSLFGFLSDLEVFREIQTAEESSERVAKYTSFLISQEDEAFFAKMTIKQATPPRSHPIPPRPTLPAG